MPRAKQTRTIAAVTFDNFQEANKRRCEEMYHPVGEWSPQLWGLAIAGEAGELCNLLKKIHRGDFTLEQKRDEVAKEVADVITYCDLLLSALGVKTGVALADKFNEVSERIGWLV